MGACAAHGLGFGALSTTKKLCQLTRIGLLTTLLTESEVKCSEITLVTLKPPCCALSAV